MEVLFAKGLAFGFILAATAGPTLSNPPTILGFAAWQLARLIQ